MQYHRGGYIDMKRTLDHIREHLTDGVYDTRRPGLEQLAEDWVHRLFGKRFDWAVQQAKHRIRMGTFRYERPEAPWPVLARLGLVDPYVTKLREKLDRYEQTGNQEMLIDALNYVLLELHEPCQEDTYYESEERYD